MSELQFLSGSFDIGKYFFADWTGVTLQFVSIWMLAYKIRLGFVLAAFSSVSLFIYASMTGSVADLLAQVIFVAMNLFAFIRWNTRTLT